MSTDGAGKTGESVGEEGRPSDQATTPPGEGERRAQRGFVPQYALAARLLYRALAAGRLKWVGLADRSAGTFDDVVLGLVDRVVAHQVKTSRDPERFSIKTLLLGKSGLWARMLDSRRRLQAGQEGLPIETVYACDDYASTDDNIGAEKDPVSSAAFIRAHEAHRSDWTLADWRASPFAGFIAELQAPARMPDEEFERVWRHTRFLVAGEGRTAETVDLSSKDKDRVDSIAALLPRLVADKTDRDRWSTGDLLRRLGWRDPFDLRHSHAFPVDVLYQSNAPTQHALRAALSSVKSGYVSLVGPPGSGKSTLLAQGLLPTPRASILRYLAFIPNEGHGLGRAEALHFLHDMVTQLKQQGFGHRIIPGTEVPELQQQLESLLHEASRRFDDSGVRTFVVVDGLDHVPREERPQRSFLSELPLPHAVPNGVVFVLGTQRLDLEGIPPTVVSQASETGRRVDVAPLPREAVIQLADAAGVPKDVDRDELYARTAGHPLSTRYVIGGLLAASTPESRQDWLRTGPAYGGDVETFYDRAWSELEQDGEAREALAFLALAEGPVQPAALDSLVAPAATNAAWQAAQHLLVRDTEGAWSIFHNSFRLFLGARTGLRFGVEDRAGVLRRYGLLADMARGAGSPDPQRWMELRYRARAEDHPSVVALATPARFRTQLLSGRDPGAIGDDIRLAFAAAGSLRSPDVIVDLMLARHELSMRSDALGDAVFEVLIDLGERRAALGLLEAEEISLTKGKGYELVDDFLSADAVSEARALFDTLEPIDTLLGSRPIDIPRNEPDILAEWAERALVFREPGQILASLDRLVAPDERMAREFDVDGYRTRLKFVAARGQLARNPLLPIEDLMGSLDLGSRYRAPLLFFAAHAASRADSPELATRQLDAAVLLLADLGHGLRRRCAALAARLDRLDLATSFIDGVPPPSLAGRNLYGDDDLALASRDIMTHAAVNAQLRRTFTAGDAPDSPLLAIYQKRLERLGALEGEGRARSEPTCEPFAEFTDTIEFLQRAEGDRRTDFHRHSIDRAMHVPVAAMVHAAAAFGPVVLSRLTGLIDARLSGSVVRLGQSKVRRAYSLAAYRHECDAGRVEGRLAYRPGLANTPAEELEEAARTAAVYAHVGLEEQARRLLTRMHDHGLGYAWEAKKDPQYLAWETLIARACEEDPSARMDRVRFLGRLLTGMAETIGSGAGRRLVRVFLEQAARVGPGLAIAAADRIEEIGFATWAEMTASLLTGVVSRAPTLVPAAAVIFGRLVLPFGGSRIRSVYPQLIEAAAAEHLQSVVSHALRCLETDAHPARRIDLLEEVVGAAKRRGVSEGIEAVGRWDSELPRRSSGENPDDPFFYARTMDDIAAILDKSDDRPRAWGAARAFARLVDKSNFDAAKRLFDAAQAIHDDERAVEALAHAAIAAGRRVDADSCLASLKSQAESRGGWGDGWSGEAKQRYHRIRVLLEGEPARQAAFDALVHDLAGRRESLDRLLPDLCEVLELLSPRPTWAATWARLQDLLSQFREYRLGRELSPPPTVSDEDHETLADILFRALENSTVEPERMALVASLELTQIPGGPAVVGALLRRLWRAGGQQALLAARIAWECRDAAAIRDTLTPFLGEMCESDDGAVRATAASVARAWELPVREKVGEMPSIYALQIPAGAGGDVFELPTGTSPISRGLYVEDIATWTWPLRDVLKAVVSATDLPMANLRARAAQLMERIGGTAVFGPEAADRQQRRLDRLGLHLPYRKLLVTAAFQAARELVGELVAAGELNPRAASFLLLHAGAFPSCLATLPREPRPPGVPLVKMVDPYDRDENAAWRTKAVEDAVRPVVPEYVVIASAAVHQIHNRGSEWIVEQYYGPEVARIKGDLVRTPTDLPTQLRRLDRVIAADQLLPLYDGFADGAVAHVEFDVAGALDEYEIVLCPRVAKDLGWKPDERDPFTYRDDTGQLAARTIRWRDGGVPNDMTDGAALRAGNLIIVRGALAERLRPYLAATQISRAWRTTKREGEAERETTSATQTAAGPTDEPVPPSGDTSESSMAAVLIAPGPVPNGE